ncbi:MAG: rhodanese-like domain-containing protein [Planctomycetes bacterium]|nr:rhodanese-like domain-containing protein [Planctomycetota bacterium]
MKYILTCAVFTLSIYAIMTADSVQETKLQPTDPASLVDYQGFAQLTNDVHAYRKTRLLDADAFVKKAEEQGVIILDTRSKFAFDRIHMKGAMHMNFSDFTAEKFAKEIPDKNTCILIYCNNNIISSDVSMVSKSMPLALNIPTFINLYGYGYKNIYELSSLVSMEDLRFKFAGSVMKPTPWATKLRAAPSSY